jgi:hypothetical protein
VVLGKNTKQFLKVIFALVGPMLVKFSQGQAKENLGASLMKSLEGVSPDIPEPLPMTQDQRLTMKIFRHFTEIHSCLERLKDFETYISRFPFQKTRVSRHAYLQFIVEAHLNEIYILRERLVAFSKLIDRAYRKDVEAKKYASYAAVMEKYVVDSLSGFARVRGAHIHARRYSHDDIDRLGLIAILEQSSDKQFKTAIRALKRMAVVDSHERLTEQTRKWNKTASKVVDEYCKAALPLLFDETRKSVRYPKLRK